MAKKVIRLTEDELKQLIKEATARVMNEMNAATYSRIYNASHRAVQETHRMAIMKELSMARHLMIL